MGTIPSRMINGKTIWSSREDCQKIIQVSSLYRFPSRLRKKNWFVIGKGAFGKAYSKGNLVWKVGINVSDTRGIISNSYMDGYIAYVQAVAMGKFGASPLVPKIYLILLDKKGRYAVLMEKLKCTFSNSSFLNTAETRKLISNSDYYARNHINYGSKIESFKRDVSWDAFVFFKKLYEYFDGLWRFDCHGENMGFRENGQVVVFDPLCWVTNPQGIELTLPYLAAHNKLKTGKILKYETK